MMRKKRAPKLSDAHRFTIRIALRTKFDAAMRALDMCDPRDGFFLKEAGAAWDAYKAFTGYPMHDAVVRS